jgi:hypothetical protein
LVRSTFNIIEKRAGQCYHYRISRHHELQREFLITLHLHAPAARSGEFLSHNQPLSVNGISLLRAHTTTHEYER